FLQLEIKNVYECVNRVCLTVQKSTVQQTQTGSLMIKLTSQLSERQQRPQLYAPLAQVVTLPCGSCNSSSDSIDIRKSVIIKASQIVTSGVLGKL
ncbi:hypothetical protein C0J52_20363, partial [Blattella germanica]